MLCSSADTIQPVFDTDFRIISSSNGLIVWILIISQLIPDLPNSIEASNASQTRWPVATIVISEPSFRRTPSPILKLPLTSVKLGTLGLPNLK